MDDLLLDELSLSSELLEEELPLETELALEFELLEVLELEPAPPWQITFDTTSLASPFGAVTLLKQAVKF